MIRFGQLAAGGLLAVVGTFFDVDRRPAWFACALVILVHAHLYRTLVDMRAELAAGPGPEGCPTCGASEPATEPPKII